MRRQIDSHLAQARATAGGTLGARAGVRDAAEALVRAMQRLYADRKLTFRIEVDPDATVRAPQEDLEEMLGNLLDNACKWAGRRWSSRRVSRGLRVIIDVADDGAGLDRRCARPVLKRGVRADQTAPVRASALPSSGLADAYGGGITLALAQVDCRAVEPSAAL
jgi:K+-sensing histidine kinase KdpD